MSADASFKLASVQKKIVSGPEFDVAVELLARAELMKCFALKRPGATGPASLCFVKRGRDQDPVAGMHVQNVLRDSFGISEITSFLCTNGDPSVGSAASNGVEFLNVTHESLTAFRDKWGHVFATTALPNVPLPSKKNTCAKRGVCSESFSQGGHYICILS